MSELPPAQAILENPQLQDLVTQLSDAEAALQAYVGGQGEGIIETLSGAPVRLRDAQLALLKSEAHNQRLANILQNVRDIIIVTDLDGTITYWNDGASAIHGYSEAEMVGHSVAALYADEALLSDYLQHIRNGLEQRLEWQARRKDGTSIWLDTRVTPMRDSDGGLIGALQVGKDISGRKQAEEPLSYSEERLDAIFEQSPLSIQVFMPDGAFVRANRAWETLWGSRREQLIGFNILTDDIGLVAQGIMPYVLKAFAGEATAVPPKYFDPAAIGQVGSARWTTARMYPIKDASGQIREVVLTHEDVTESVLATAAVQRSEEHFKALIQNSADVIQLVSREGLIAYVSPSVTRVLGFAPSELVGRPVPELLHPDELERMQASFMGLLQRPGSIETFEQRVRHKDGSWRWIEVTASNLFENPAVQALIINYRDITERKRIEAALQTNSEQLHTMTQQLWQSAKLATMGELAASIAHELNNPLGTVSLRIESLLDRSSADDPQRRELLVVEQEVERMSTLVASLLQFSRRSAPQISTLDVREEIDKSLELIHYMLRQHQIIVRREVDPDLPMVQADHQQLRQLFLNLFTNASDAMPGGGTLIIRVKAAPIGGQVVIEVTDTGTGIAPEDLANVMEAFFTTKPEGKGTGLGLAICRRIVQEHNGTFEITSAGTGLGATVRLTLPGNDEENGAFLREV